MKCLRSQRRTFSAFMLFSLLLLWSSQWCCQEVAGVSAQASAQGHSHFSASNDSGCNHCDTHSIPTMPDSSDCFQGGWEQSAFALAGAQVEPKKPDAPAKIPLPVIAGFLQSLLPDQPEVTDGKPVTAFIAYFSGVALHDAFGVFLE